MTFTLPLETMTVNDKLRTMESIWESFSQNPIEMESSAWHDDVLAARKTRVSNGVSRYDDWEKAKRCLKNALGRKQGELET